jgi:hypothetical protein
VSDRSFSSVPENGECDRARSVTTGRALSAEESARKITAGRFFLLSGALLFVATAAVVVWQNSRLAILWDLSYVLENASRIALGQRPYRDFPFPYAPLTFLFQAAIIRLFGRVVWHHAAYAAAAGGAATVAAFALTRRLLGVEGVGGVLAATLLSAPLTVLGIYAIVPHPFYDPDACLAVLLLLVVLLSERAVGTGAQPRPPAVGGSIATGAALVVPLFVKQNIGVAFLIPTVCALVAVWLTSSGAAAEPFGVDGVRRSRLLLAGVVLGTGAAAALIAIFFGWSNYMRWTVRFAVARRLPPLRDQFDLYASPMVWIWLALFVAGVVVARLRGRFEVRGRLVGAVLMGAPWLHVASVYFSSDDPDEWEIDLLTLWPFIMVLSLLASAFVIRRRGLTMKSLLPVIIVATIHGTFLSQSTWGSTYGIWPFFALLVAFTIGAAEVGQPASLIVSAIVALTMLIVGSDYIGSSHRLIYAKVGDGPSMHSSIPVLRGLTVRGRWLPDFEQLLAFTEREIPRDDAILSMPGEDLFYFTTGRVPKFPVIMFDRTISPYSPSEIAALAVERDVRWIIVKKRLQVNGQPMPDLARILMLLAPRFELVARLSNYDIYRRSIARLEWSGGRFGRRGGRRGGPQRRPSRQGRRRLAAGGRWTRAPTAPRRTRRASTVAMRTPVSGTADSQPRRLSAIV